METQMKALMKEHLALMECYAQAQRIATHAIHEHQCRVEWLERQMMLLRAKLIQRETALQWEREAHMRTAAVLQWKTRQHQKPSGDLSAWKAIPVEPHTHSVSLPEAVHAQPSPLTEADLVICQTACIGHGAYWQVEEHCRRTGTPCMLVERPGSVRIVQIQATNEAQTAASNGETDV